MPPFTDDVYVNNNDWSFFLGDTIWEPIENKIGIWRIIIQYLGDIVAEKRFDIKLDTFDVVDDFSMLNRKFNHKKR